MRLFLSDIGKWLPVSGGRLIELRPARELRDLCRRSADWAAGAASAAHFAGARHSLRKQEAGRSPPPWARDTRSVGPGRPLRAGVTLGGFEPGQPPSPKPRPVSVVFSARWGHRRKAAPGPWSPENQAFVSVYFSRGQGSAETHEGD